MVIRGYNCEESRIVALIVILKNILEQISFDIYILYKSVVFKLLRTIVI